MRRRQAWFDGQSGQWRGKRFIGGGRAAVRSALYMGALVAARFTTASSQRASRRWSLPSPSPESSSPSSTPSSATINHGSQLEPHCGSVRYGSRRVHVLLRREDWQVNIKKTRRIYNELGLQLRNKHPKRRVKAKLREDRQEAAGPNEVWVLSGNQNARSVTIKVRMVGGAAA